MKRPASLHPRCPPAWIIGLGLLLVVPFAAQPVHMDDNLYVDIGRNVQENPWQAHDLPYCFEGECVSDLASHSHPPFVGYWIGLLIWLFGDGPRLHVMLHLGFLVFPVLFSIGMYRLAARFTHSPRLATLLAITSPAAVVMSHNLMTDYPTLALWTFGTALYVRGVDSRQSGPVWASGVFLALAAFASYPALGGAVLCLSYGWLKRTRMAAAYWAPVLATAFMIAWLAYSSIYFGRFVLSATATYFVATKGSLGLSALAQKVVSFPILLVGTIVLPLPLVHESVTWFRGVPALVSALSAVLLTWLYKGASYSLPELVLVAVCVTGGGYVILGLIRRVLRSAAGGGTDSGADVLFLAGWIAWATVTALFVYSNGAARYLLPMLVPVVLLSLMRSEEMGPRLWRWSAVAGVGFALMIGVSLSLADFELARTHRDIAEYLGDQLEGWESATRFGGEWGFRHYMSEQGFRPFVSTQDDFRPGELIVLPRLATPYRIPAEVRPRLIPVGREVWYPHIPLHLMNDATHSGFYSSFWGLLPLSVSTGPLEEVSIFQVSVLGGNLDRIAFESQRGGDLELRSDPRGGVDLVIPGPGTLAIPHDGGAPVRIRFECRGPDPFATDCPVRGDFVSGKARSALALEKIASDGRDRGETWTMRIDSAGPGVIVLNVDGGTGPDGVESALVLGNWLVLPADSSL